MGVFNEVSIYDVADSEACIQQDPIIIDDFIFCYVGCFLCHGNIICHLFPYFIQQQHDQNFRHLW